MAGASAAVRRQLWTFPHDVELQHGVYLVPEQHWGEHANGTATIALRYRALWSQQYTLNTLSRGGHRRTAVVVCAVYVRSSLHLGQNAGASEIDSFRVDFSNALSIEGIAISQDEKQGQMRVIANLTRRAVSHT